MAPAVALCRASGDDVVVAIRPTRNGQAPSAGSVRSDPKPSDEQALLHELWQISHFGWIPEAAIRRALTIAGGQELSTVAVAERLGRLVERG